MMMVLHVYISFQLRSILTANPTFLFGHRREFFFFFLSLLSLLTLNNFTTRQLHDQLITRHDDLQGNNVHARLFSISKTFNRVDVQFRKKKKKEFTIPLENLIYAIIG